MTTRKSQFKTMAQEIASDCNHSDKCFLNDADCVCGMADRIEAAMNDAFMCGLYDGLNDSKMVSDGLLGKPFNLPARKNESK